MISLTHKTRAEMLNAFYRYGFLFGPLNGKYPITQGGLRNFTRDAGQIRQWLKRYPRCNWGARRPGVIVLDIDPRNGGDIDVLGVDPTATLTVATGGGGWHLYYTYAPATPGKLRVHNGIDIKNGNTGYTVMPGSVHPDTGRVYEIHADPGVIAPLPDHLINAITPAKPQPRSNQMLKKNSAPLDESGLIQTVLNADEGTRNGALYWALCRCRENGSDPQTVIGLRDAALSIGLDPPEIERTIRSALGS